ncbi:uncharacterized protein FOMMEDRAFT_140601 [Fomitiporia mediterranea MF3/22]|uniref:uncharacterized protein n=1 Tax=Fomitiporia mediterranea (strain MF3/22) TaxID=694068 RepID=UPI000440747B|nr:uncharacterized protein FOMMEDRAFT_140601 [Fomitiporia mediterranea MF3/22]EJD02698.1 hypothetical protein FOMMEDRAFT_140601 [Fomitiporia mediterranea MF3/22]
MVSRILRTLTAALALYATNVAANVTVYGTATTDASGALATTCIGAVACDGRVLTPPGGQPNFNPSIPVQLYSGGMSGLSIGIPGHFGGFSIELSIADKLLGSDGDHLNPIFLNLMSTLTSRAGMLYLRIGGNTQDKATILADGLPDGKTIEKADDNASTTFTPRLLVSPNILYAMNNISSLLPIKWFLGVPFNDTQNPRLLMGELGEKILGDNLLGLQLGNEPDLYFNNQIRPADYNPTQYNSEWGQVLQAYMSDTSISNNSMFIAPSVCCGPMPGWTPEMVWDTGFLDNYKDHLSWISVQRYPTNNCNSSGTVIDPQSILESTFLNHNAVQGTNTGYINTTNIAQGIGKPVVMFETNTASCGGFSGLSDSFAASLWTVDYSLNMAMTNFSHALYHVGGQSDFYNAFTPMAPNQTNIRQWTIGSTFYPMLLLTEAFGSSGAAQVVDLFMNSNSQWTPGYVIYEHGNPARVVLMNFLTDSSGASNYTAYISVGGNTTNTPGATPASVQVKYLLANSASDKFGITWAGQSFGGPFESDGRMQGQEMIYTYQCDQANNVCAIPVPAPGAALVFLNSDALSESGPKTTQTFATTAAATAAANTATVDQAVLATSNGRGGGKWDSSGSTSFGSTGGAMGASAMLASAGLTGAIALFGAAAFVVGYGGWP